MFHKILHSVPASVTEDRLDRLNRSFRRLFAMAAGIDASDLLPEVEDQVEAAALAALCAPGRFPAMIEAGGAVYCMGLSYRAETKRRRAARARALIS